MGADFATKEGAQKIKEEQKNDYFLSTVGFRYNSVLEEIIHI